jgi:integrase/recombinase XerD
MATKQHYIDRADSELGEPIVGFIESVASDWTSNTTRNRFVDTKDYWEWLCENDLDASQTSTVKRYLESCKARGMSDGTVYSRYNSIKKLYDYILIDDPNPESHPFKDSAGNKVPSLKSSKYSDSGDSKSSKQALGETPRLTPEQVSRLLDHVPTPRVRNRVIISLLDETGIRQSELRHIKLTDLNLDGDKLNNEDRRVANGNDRSLHIRMGKGSDGSGPRERFVVIPSDLAFRIKQYVYGGYRSESSYADESPYLFPTRKSEKIGKTAVKRMLRRASGMDEKWAKNHETAGITEPQWTDSAGRRHGPVHAHAFRHSFMYNRLDEGVPPRVLMEWTGHQDLDLILRYSEMSDEESIQQGMKYIK